MNTHVTKQFVRIGARLKLADRPSGRRRMVSGIALDVLKDREGEFFELALSAPSKSELVVLDVQPAERHLLLMVREGTARSKFLCGHDERHWFVAGVPEVAPANTVRQAMEALKPAAVRAAQQRLAVPTRVRNRRKTAAYIRQGEWFFVPVPGLKVDSMLVLHNEPLTRSTGGKPHWAEFCYRKAGEQVYVCSRFPHGLTGAQYARLLARDPEARGWGWQILRRNPEVYVTGRIRHQDHATIKLREWYRVWMSRENESAAMRHVAFLD